MPASSAKSTPGRRQQVPGLRHDSDVVPLASRGTRPGPDDYASRVLDVVDAIPPGSVMSYGDVAEVLGDGGPRQVGRVMALWGGGVAWWRVVHADGSLLAGHERAALARYAAEGTPLRVPAGTGNGTGNGTCTGTCTCTGTGTGNGGTGNRGGGGLPRIDMRRARLRV